MKKNRPGIRRLPRTGNLGRAYALGRSQLGKLDDFDHASGIVQGGGQRVSVTKSELSRYQRISAGGSIRTARFVTATDAGDEFLLFAGRTEAKPWRARLWSKRPWNTPQPQKALRGGVQGWHNPEHWESSRPDKHLPSVSTGSSIGVEISRYIDQNSDAVLYSQGNILGYAPSDTGGFIGGAALRIVGGRVWIIMLSPFEDGGPTIYVRPAPKIQARKGYGSYEFITEDIPGESNMYHPDDNPTGWRKVEGDLSGGFWGQLTGRFVFNASGTTAVAVELITDAAASHYGKPTGSYLIFCDVEYEDGEWTAFYRFEKLFDLPQETTRYGLRVKKFRDSDSSVDHDFGLLTYGFDYDITSRGWTTDIPPDYPDFYDTFYSCNIGTNINFNGWGSEDDQLAAARDDILIFTAQGLNAGRNTAEENGQTAFSALKGYRAPGWVDMAGDEDVPIDRFTMHTGSTADIMHVGQGESGTSSTATGFYEEKVAVSNAATFFFRSLYIPVVRVEYVFGDISIPALEDRVVEYTDEQEDTIWVDSAEDAEWLEHSVRITETTSSGDIIVGADFIGDDLVYAWENHDFQTTVTRQNRAKSLVTEGNSHSINRFRFDSYESTVDRDLSATLRFSNGYTKTLHTFSGSDTVLSEAELHQFIPESRNPFFAGGGHGVPDNFQIISFFSGRTDAGLAAYPNALTPIYPIEAQYRKVTNTRTVANYNRLFTYIEYLDLRNGVIVHVDDDPQTVADEHQASRTSRLTFWPSNVIVANIEDTDSGTFFPNDDYEEDQFFEYLENETSGGTTGQKLPFWARPTAVSQDTPSTRRLKVTKVVMEETDDASIGDSNEITVTDLATYSHSIGTSQGPGFNVGMFQRLVFPYTEDPDDYDAVSVEFRGHASLFPEFFYKVITSDIYGNVLLSVFDFVDDSHYDFLIDTQTGVVYDPFDLLNALDDVSVSKPNTDFEVNLPIVGPF